MHNYTSRVRCKSRCAQWLSPRASSLAAAIALVALGCFRAESRAEEARLADPVPFSDHHVLRESELSDVRAGTKLPMDTPQQVSVILWDERRIAPTPIRDSVDPRVTAQMNVFQKQ